MKTEMWDDGEACIIYSEDLSMIRDIMHWKVSGISEMADYTKLSQIYALQIRFPGKLRNRVAKRCGLPEMKLRTLSDEDIELRSSRVRKWRFMPSAEDASFTA